MNLTIIQKLLILVGISIVSATITTAIIKSLFPQYFIYIFIVLLSLVLTCVYFLIKKLIKEPIDVLVRVTEKVAQGEYTYQLPINRRDEIGNLAKSFNEMLEALKRTMVSKDQMQTILSNMVNSVIVVSPAMTIEMVNAAACAVLGYTQEELVGKPMSILFAAIENQQKAPEHICRWVNKNGFIFGMEETYVSKFGRPIPVIISASALRDNDGRLKSIICVGVDNTERKRIENQLRQTNKELINNEMKMRQVLLQVQQANKDLKNTQAQLLQSEKLASLGHLAAGIAHEINNPVGFINSNLQTLSDYVKSYTDYFHAIDNVKASLAESNYTKAADDLKNVKILEERLNMSFINDDINLLVNESLSGTERIRKIVADLRTFARADGEQDDFINIEEVLNSICSIVSNEIKYKAQLVKLYTGVPKVKANPQRIGQVFINLLINAAQAIQDKGTIELSTAVENDYVCVSVKDTGCGIPVENLSKIFDPFFTTKPVGNGTGLGLSISYDIVKKHGGLLEVKSEVGKGTTFIVKLPILKVSEGQQKESV